MNVDTLTTEQFKKLPLVVEGESKEVRYAGKGLVVIRLKPTVYSFTHNRTGIIPGSDATRLLAIKLLLPVLHEAGIHHSYKAINDKWILSTLVLQPFTKGTDPFRPTDLTDAEMAVLPVAPPIEVVAKAVHSGTPKHRYYRFSDYPTRVGTHIDADTTYPNHVIRFDWRNPMRDKDGNRLADEVLSEQMADWFIDVPAAAQTAQTAFQALRKFIAKKGLDLWDICFFISQDGKTMFGEVSPDCLRVRSATQESLDKDVWRAGGSSDQVLTKWQTFLDYIDATGDDHGPTPR